MEQEAYWVTGWGIHMPWIGLDQQGCGYLKHNCTAETVTDVQKFSYPINIMKEYPRVSFKKIICNSNYLLRNWRNCIWQLTTI